ncbi:hypothetical protein CYG48_05045 [Neorhizobium sp. SOG26]|uniref:hypothetical protein n=1 Tax=Neorhizobium sp. SOG26 TaxID=2060726 RepID=UPI000E584C51|nr:hypothetical protein [Neorhizobium sp. SOG26]AXV15120.1 hypothetical protein CYG48_05045 [Neorhizobium sp. SOG26]
MPRVNAPLYSLNGGEVGDEALARLDLERLQFAGSLYLNMLPRVIGSMTLRPGLEHIAMLDLGPIQFLEYAYSGRNALLPVLSNGQMRVINGRSLVSRVAVSTTVTNGNFGSFSGWTDASTGGASASVSSGDLVLVGTSQGHAIARQAITVSSADQTKEHALRLDVERGPVTVKVGTSAGDDDLFSARNIDDGVHSLAFTPFVSTIYVEISNEKARDAIVESCMFEAAGTMVIPTPWQTEDLTANLVKYRQNTDVLYASSTYFQQREIQRRGDTSWGIQRYKVDDGPFVAADTTAAINPTGYVGTINLVSDRPHFDSKMIGRLYRLFQSGQAVFETFTSAPANSAAIRVSGVGAARTFTYQLGGTWSGTMRLQVAPDSGGSPGAWTDVATFTSNVASSYTDPDNNVIKYFRWALQSGDYTSGTIGSNLMYQGGSQSGVARVIGYTSPTQVTAEVLSRFYSLNATFDWDVSVWSDYDGWPSAVENFGGRLFWGKDDLVYGSVPDAYKSFDDQVEGDSAPIARSIGAGTDRGILWLIGLERLLAGTDLSEISIKASSFDEPLTASAWFPVDASTFGSANVRAVKVDKDGIFIQASGTGAYRLAQNQGGDYSSADLMAMHEQICGGSNIVDIAVQRRPDTTVWFVLANGEARCLTYEPSENVIAWSRVVTDGQFTNVAACRGAGQDSVYFAVVRSGTKRLERLADMTDCRGGTVNCLADGFTRFTATASQTTFSVPHLSGKQVVVWVDGKAVRDQSNLATVTGGNVVIPAVAAGKSVVIGLPYVGRWKSTKLAYGAGGGTALFQRKKVAQLGLYLVKTMLDGLRVGRDFNTLRQLTTTSKGAPIAPGTLQEAFDADLMPISSDWDTDSRVCIEARAPYPFTAAGLVMDVTTNG